MQPIVKWTGSKRHVAEEIIGYFPENMDVYYEPFIGSASLLPVLSSSNIRPNQVICSDINRDLIDIYRLIQKSPEEVVSKYRHYWNIMNNIVDETERKSYYYKLRDKYNLYHCPLLFLFLTRVCYNGLIRYNKKGQFNAPYHFNRPGINTESFTKLLWGWNDLLKNVKFECCDYQSIKPRKDDFIFLDPPYFNVRTEIYYGKIKFNEFVKYLSQLKCKYILTLDGKNEKDDKTCRLPKELGLSHKYLKMGNSSLRRLKGQNNLVNESLYKNF